jgi:hypothetical protein
MTLYPISNGFRGGLENNALPGRFLSLRGGYDAGTTCWTDVLVQWVCGASGEDIKKQDLKEAAGRAFCAPVV